MRAGWLTLIGAVALLVGASGGCTTPGFVDDDDMDDDSGDDDTAGDDDSAAADDDDSSGAADDDDSATGDDDDSAQVDCDQVSAAEGDVTLVFTAAAPDTYDHITGGGAYDDGTVGDDVVNSLQGGDFACGEAVSVLVALQTPQQPVSLDSTVELEFSFLANTTGQPGAAFGAVTTTTMNHGAVSGGDGPGGTDAWLAGDQGSVAVEVDHHYEPLGTTLFGGAEELRLTARVDDLEPSEQEVLRLDVWLACDAGSSPTGNLQARLLAAAIVESQGCPIDPPVILSTGEQTLPMHGASDIEPDPDP